MTLHGYIAGEVVTASNLNESVNPKVAIKTSNETVNNSTTLQNDDQLFITPTINKKYWVHCFIAYVSVGSAAELKIDFTFPAGASFSWVPIGATPTDANQEAAQQAAFLRMGLTSATTSRAIGTMATSVNLVATVMGLLVMGSTAGNLQFRFAQQTATVENTQVLADSFMVGTLID